MTTERPLSRECQQRYPHNLNAILLYRSYSLFGKIPHLGLAHHQSLLLERTHTVSYVQSYTWYMYKYLHAVRPFSQQQRLYFTEFFQLFVLVYLNWYICAPKQHTHELRGGAKVFRESGLLVRLRHHMHYCLPLTREAERTASGTYEFRLLENTK